MLPARIRKARFKETINLWGEEGIAANWRLLRTLKRLIFQDLGESRGNLGILGLGIRIRNSETEKVLGSKGLTI